MVYSTQRIGLSKDGHQKIRWSIEYTFIISQSQPQPKPKAKILFTGKAKNIKNRKGYEPLFGEPCRARRATKSMGGAVRRQRNGIKNAGKYGSGVFIQLRSNLL